MQHFTATLIDSEALAPHTFILHLGGCEPLAACDPGQFVMMRGEWGRDPLLPRAFSVQALREGGRAEILVKTIGRGTALLEAARPGARFELLGPLGTRFPAPAPDRIDWLVAGGVGLAPLLFHAERAARAGLAGRVRMFYGGRSARDLVLLERMRALGIGLDLATEDGSAGTRGFVTAALAAALGRAEHAPTILACGPDPMLIALATIARASGVKAWLSLEGPMACGIGVCLGCAVACATKPWRYICKDGPVMSLDELRGPYAAGPSAGASGEARSEAQPSDLPTATTRGRLR
jgi:dihydroorotate dehydrogenase electron transfer subunit